MTDQWEETGEQYEPVDDQTGGEADAEDLDQIPAGYVGPTGGRGPDDQENE